MNGQGADWFFTTAKTLKKCGYCGRRAGFHEETVTLADEYDRDFEVRVLICNHCGEFNGEVEDE